MTCPCPCNAYILDGAPATHTDDAGVSWASWDCYVNRMVAQAEAKRDAER